MKELDAFDAYHRAFGGDKTPDGTEFVVRYFDNGRLAESPAFARRADALAGCEHVRRILGPLSGATVVALTPNHIKETP